MKGWEVVIGLETHVQLATRSKIFSGASTAFGAPPNTQATRSTSPCPACCRSSTPAALECAVKFGLAVGAEISRARCSRARTTSIRPAQGLPDQPVRDPGGLGRRAADRLAQRASRARSNVRLTRAQLERRGQVAGTRTRCARSAARARRHVGHRPQPRGHAAARDRHRPVLRSSAEAVAYARALHVLGHLARHLRRQHAGGLVPLRRERVGAPVGQAEFGTRCEIKNLNSFGSCSRRSSTRCAAGRADRGRRARRAGTRLYDPRPRRDPVDASKEDAHDYRYFPRTPDLPPLVGAGAGRARARGAARAAGRDRARFERELGSPPTTRSR